jgi:His/Glu/Gln/Arg/opine family amino acid ABC transporter permease subunit
MLSFSVPFFFHEIGVALRYLPVVAVLSIVPLVGGIALGTLIALCRVYRVPVLERIAQAYVVLFRAIPILLQMLLAYYLTKAVYRAWDLGDVNKFAVILVTLTLCSAGFLSENIRSALQSVEKGQYEAADSVGLPRRTTFFRVVVPQSLPVAVPVIGSAFIVIIKGSSAAYLLGVIEMIQATTMEVSGNYRFLEAYCATAVIYWGLTVCVEHLSVLVERRVRQHLKGGVA